MAKPFRPRVGKRSRRRSKGAPAQPPAATSEYRDEEGNVLVLRDALSEGTLRELDDLDARPAATAEDRWQRRVEYLFERLVVRWEIAGTQPISRQKELLARYRFAGQEERRWIRDVLREHVAEWFPDVAAP